MKNFIVNNYPLDKEQLKPIIENPKYSIIIAGAGSGKTITLVGKVKYLLEHQNYKKEEILCISFTNEAAIHLKETIKKNCNCTIDTYTFHKLALEILKRNHISYTIAKPNLLDYVIDEFFASKCFGNQMLSNYVYHIFHYFSKSDKNWNKLLQSKNLIALKKTILSFLKLFQCNYQIEEFKTFFQSQKDKPLLTILYSIYLIYETEKKSTSSIDFDDMILLATKVLQTNKTKLPYKMIMIDEFQDTSIHRFSLIKEILQITNASLCVVGDDYQSIYHFSGCDLSLFLDFTKLLPNAKTYKLEKTYRNSQELIFVAGNFICKNKHQIPKELKSDKTFHKPIKLIYYYNENTILEKIIRTIPTNSKILILGRNHFDLDKYTKYLKYELNEKNDCKFKKFPNHLIRYLTIHKAKGLESDKVILLNASNDIYGIPSLKQEEAILKYVKKSLFYPYEEERRLFYVALTRTKEDIYILVPKKNPSIFIEEIKKQKNVEKKIIL